MSELTRRCGGCLAWLPLGAFDFRDRARTRPQSYCRDCAKDAWRRWYRDEHNHERHLEQVARRRRRRIERHQWLVREAKDRPCADCGRRFPPEAMDFDHREGTTKLAEVSALVTRSGTATLLAEMAKCDVVCAVCHRLRTAARRQHPGELH